MKNLTILFLGLFIIFGTAGNAVAQAKPQVKFASAKQNGSTVSFTLTSNKPFRMGGNMYLLHINNKDFTRSKQNTSNGKGTITFYVPVAEVNEFKEGADMYLTYGRLFRNGQDEMKELSLQAQARCWDLGNFSKSLLSK